MTFLRLGSGYFAAVGGLHAFAKVHRVVDMLQNLCSISRSPAPAYRSGQGSDALEMVYGLLAQYDQVLSDTTARPPPIAKKGISSGAESV